MFKPVSTIPIAFKPAKSEAAAPIANSKKPLLPLKAAKAVDRLLDFYGALDVGGPEAFTAALVAMFGEYPDEVIERAINPVRGIPARVKLLRLATIREILDEINGPFRRDLERKRRTEEARRGLQLPRPKRTPAEQARVDEQVERVRAELGIPQGGYQRGRVVKDRGSR